MKALQFSLWFCVGLFSELTKPLLKFILAITAIAIVLTPFFWQVLAIFGFVIIIFELIGKIENGI